ncbi:MAG: DUF2917 domain-containing protein [Betaproteobacteria bacterium]
MLCAGYTKVLDLANGDLVKLDDARGTTLRVTRGTVWVTQQHDRNDVVLRAGDVWTVERDGLTLVEAQATSAMCLVGPGAAPAHVRERRLTGGDRLRGLFARLVHA